MSDVTVCNLTDYFMTVCVGRVALRLRGPPRYQRIWSGRAAKLSPTEQRWYWSEISRVTHESCWQVLGGRLMTQEHNVHTDLQTQRAKKTPWTQKLLSDQKQVKDPELISFTSRSSAWTLTSTGGSYQWSGRQTMENLKDLNKNTPSWSVLKFNGAVYYKKYFSSFCCLCWAG